MTSTNPDECPVWRDSSGIWRVSVDRLDDLTHRGRWTDPVPRVGLWDARFTLTVLRMVSGTSWGDRPRTDLADTEQIIYDAGYRVIRQMPVASMRLVDWAYAAGERRDTVGVTRLVKRALIAEGVAVRPPRRSYSAAILAAQQGRLNKERRAR